MCLKGHGQCASALLSRCREIESLMQHGLAGKVLLSRLGSMCMGGGSNHGQEPVTLLLGATLSEAQLCRCLRF